MQFDLESPGALSALSKQVLSDIDNSAIKLYSDGHRNHLGASQIGHPCYRKSWYTFRWVRKSTNTGRQLRLLNRGNREEARFTEWLTEAGYLVMPVNPQTNKQWRIEGVKGHFGGSMDGIAYLPKTYNLKQDTAFILEYKTNGTGQGFNKLLEKSCAIAKPEHFDQQCVYGYKMQIPYSIYLNVCKNDDNIHAEVIKLDLQRGQDLEKKAEVIIFAKQPLKRISESITVSTCQICEFKNVCHGGVPYEKNCRSCIFVEPIDNAKWQCNKWNSVIPDNIISEGCDAWSPAI
jgi:hypothetical protein